MLPLRRTGEPVLDQQVELGGKHVHQRDVLFDHLNQLYDLALSAVDLGAATHFVNYLNITEWH